MRRCRGFSLAELLVAVGILAVLGVIAMPSFAALMQTYRLNSATLQLASDLRYAQSLAVSNGAYYRLRWANDLPVNQLNTYRVEKSTNASGTSWPAADATMASSPNVITSWMNLGVSYPGVSLNAIRDANNAALNWVIYNSRGSSVDPGNAGLANPITLNVSSPDGTTKTIQVRRTGSVKIL